MRAALRLLCSRSLSNGASPLVLHTVSGFVPKKPTANIPDCGEDAFFSFSSDVDPGFSYLGVADGVGGWARLGIDSSVVSWGLMNHCESLLRGAILFSSEHHGHPCVYEHSPKMLLLEAFLEICLDPEIETGSSTISLAFFDGSLKKIFGTNLGDSGLRVLRKDAGEEGAFGVVFESPVQLHGFNFPCQLSLLENELGGSDLPIDAEDFEFDVRLGDVLLLATDGVFDNIYENEICDIVSSCCSAVENDENEVLWLSEVRDVLLEQVAANARDRTYRSPFAVECDEELASQGVVDFLPHEGGKLDDITFLLSIVGEGEGDEFNSV